MLITNFSCEQPQTKNVYVRTGDLIFQKSKLPEHMVMSFIEEGFYNHCGIIIEKNNNLFVLSAEKTVKFLSLNEWISKGEDRKYIIYRLDKKLKHKINMIIRSAMTLKGKVYDFQFQWENNKIYNTELIHHAFLHGANIYLGEFSKIGEVQIMPADFAVFNKYSSFIPFNKEVITVPSIMRYNNIFPVFGN